MQRRQLLQEIGATSGILGMGGNDLLNNSRTSNGSIRKKSPSLPDQKRTFESMPKKKFDENLVMQKMVDTSPAIYPKLSGNNIKLLFDEKEVKKNMLRSHEWKPQSSVDEMVRNSSIHKEMKKRKRIMEDTKRSVEQKHEKDMRKMLRENKHQQIDLDEIRKRGSK